MTTYDAKGAPGSPFKSIRKIQKLIQESERRAKTKHDIIELLKKKGISENQIIEAYSVYYETAGLYQITYNKRPLGFTVMMDTRAKNAIITSIQDEKNTALGMTVGSRIYEINGRHVYNLKHKKILQLMTQQSLPFHVVFKEVCIKIYIP